MFLCVTVGPDRPAVKVPSEPPTVAPHSPPITTASQTASINNSTTAQSATSMAWHPDAVPTIQPLTTKNQPSVTEAKAGVVTPLQLTTLSRVTVKKTPPQPGILGILAYLYFCLP